MRTWTEDTGGGTPVDVEVGSGVVVEVDDVLFDVVVDDGAAEGLADEVVGGGGDGLGGGGEGSLDVVEELVVASMVVLDLIFLRASAFSAAAASASTVDRRLRLRGRRWHEMGPAANNTNKAIDTWND